jgi:hypothetical protein
LWCDCNLINFLTHPSCRRASAARRWPPSANTAARLCCGAAGRSCDDGSDRRQGSGGGGGGCSRCSLQTTRRTCASPTKQTDLSREIKISTRWLSAAVSSKEFRFSRASKRFERRIFITEGRYHQTCRADKRNSAPVTHTRFTSLFLESCFF